MRVGWGQEWSVQAVGERARVSSLNVEDVILEVMGNHRKVFCRK